MKFKAALIAVGLFVLVVVALVFVGADQLAHGATQDQVSEMTGTGVVLGFGFAILTALTWYWTRKRS